MELQKYYFTFGSSSQFPFGVNEYVVIRAKDEAVARDIFGEYFPNPEHPDTLNFAFCYNEKEWDSIRNEYYPGISPSAIITERYKEELEEEREL